MELNVQPNLNVNPNTNPFNGAVQGAQAGMDYAAQQASIDINRQHLQMQQEQHEQMKQEFQAKLGNQMMEGYNDFAIMPNDSPLKKVKAKNWKEMYSKAGVLSDANADEWLAAANDPGIQQQWNKLNSTVSNIDDPKYKQAILAGSVGLFGGKVGQTMFKDLNDKIIMAQAMRDRGVEAAKIGAAAGIQKANIGADAGIEKAQIGADAVRERIANVSQRAGQRTYDQDVRPIRQALEGGKRAISLIDEVQSAKDPDDRIRATKQFRTLLANEEARLVTQKANFGEGTAANVAIDSYASRAKDLASKVLDEPEDTVSPENLKQARMFYTDLAGQYMNAHDRLATQQIGGATAAQREAILGRAKQFQKSYEKAFGGWKGEGIQLPSEDGDNSSQSGAAAPAQQQAPSAPPKSQAAGASITPKQLQAAQAIRQKLQTLQPGAEKDHLLLQIQRIDPELRKKVGLP